jgi:hypothetical protein
MIRVLLATVLLLNGGLPAMPIANASPTDGTQPQHYGHDMSDMAMAGDSAGQPATDCCADGSMNCHCGCVAQQPGVPNFLVTIQAREGAPERAVASISSHISNSITNPFRPPA